VHLINSPVRYLSWETTPTASKNSPSSSPANSQAKYLLGTTTGQCQTAESFRDARRGWKKFISVKLQAAGLMNGAEVGRAPERRLEEGCHGLEVRASPAQPQPSELWSFTGHPKLQFWSGIPLWAMGWISNPSYAGSKLEEVAQRKH